MKEMLLDANVIVIIAESILFHLFNSLALPTTSSPIVDIVAIVSVVADTHFL